MVKRRRTIRKDVWSKPLRHWEQIAKTGRQCFIEGKHTCYDSKTRKPRFFKNGEYYDEQA